MSDLCCVNIGEEHIVKKIKLNKEEKQNLQDMGLNIGKKVSLVSKNDTGVIVQSGSVRIALDKDIALKIEV